MKNLKKLIAVVLTFTLVFSAMAVGFAGTFSDVKDDAPYASAVARLQSLGLVSGMPDGTYQPDGAVTRAQMIAFVNAAEGLQDAAKLAVGPTKFSDVPASYWASGDINIADPSGYPDGTFKPDNTVTYPEALAMLLRALGYTADYSWPYGVIAKATNVGITDGVTLSANATITRGEMAMLVNNALDLDINKYDSNGVEVDSGTKLISKATNMTEYLVVATHDVDSSVAEGKVKVQEVASTESSGKLDFKTATTINEGSVDFNKYLGKVVDVYSAKNGDPIAVDVVSNDNTFTTDNSDNVANAVYDENGNNITSELQGTPSNTPIIYNGVKTTLGASGVVIYNGATVTLTDTDNDGKYDFIVVNDAYKYVPLTVTSDVASTDAYIETNGESLQVSGGSITTVNVTGSVSSLSDIKAGDVVYYAVSADGTKVTIYDVRNSITGTVTAVSQASDGTYTVTINGKDYTVSGNYVPHVNDNGTFALDKDGKIAGFTGTTASTNYAYVLGIDSYNSSANPQIKLLTSDGKTAVYSYDENGNNVTKDVYGNIENLWSGSIIQYSINSDNVVTNIKAYYNPTYDNTGKVNPSDYDYDNYVIKINGVSYPVSTSAVVFNSYNGTYNALSISDVKTNSLNVLNYALDDYGNVVALVVSNASLSTATESTMYGMVNDVTTVNTSSGTYYKLDVLANGTEKTYTTVTSVYETPAQFEVYQISLNDDGLISALTKEALTPADNVKIVGHSSTGITLDSSTKVNGKTSLPLGSSVTVVKYDSSNSDYYVVGLNSLATSATNATTAKVYYDSNGRVQLIIVK